MVETITSLVVLEPYNDSSSHREKQKKARLVEAMERHLGNITMACREVGLSRKTFYRYYENDIEFRESIDDMENVKLDFAELHLFKQIKMDIPSSTQFYLDRKGRRRGYERKDTIQHQGNVNVVFQPIFEGV